MNETKLPSDWKNLDRILCIRLDAMGDVLMTEPAIRAIRESNPQARISLLTSQSGAEAARLMPVIDEVIVFEAPWMKATPRRHEASIDLSFIASLRSREFDAAVIFTVYSQNPQPAAYFAYLAEIPLRLAHSRENPYQLLTHWVRETEPEQTLRHEVRRQLDLVASVGCLASDERLKVKVSETSRAVLRARLGVHGVDLEDPFLVVHAGASAASRRYPAEKFGRAIGELSEKLGWPIFLSGSRAEKSLVEKVNRASDGRAISLCGELRLGEFAALLERAVVLISNNTGAVHLASAVRTPVVDLYALTNPQHTPWMVPNRVLFDDVECRYCYKSECPFGHGACLQNVEPKRVVEASFSLLCELGFPEAQAAMLSPVLEVTS